MLYNIIVMGDECTKFDKNPIASLGDVDENKIHLGDFVHDFTAFILAGDTVLRSRESNITNYITKFTYSILASAFGFDSHFIRCNSNLKTPTFRLSPKYNKHSLEHMFYKYLGITSKQLFSEDTEFPNDSFDIKKINVKVPETYNETYKEIHEFFSDYSINEKSIDKVVPLVVDAQTKLFKIIKTVRDAKSQTNKYFGYCLNQEVCNDAAGKKNFKEPKSVEYFDYYYAETDSGNLRTYYSDQFGGIFNVTFNKMMYTGRAQDENNKEIDTRTRPFCNVTLTRKIDSQSSIWSGWSLVGTTAPAKKPFEKTHDSILNS
jgi:hypothetical protein